MSEMEDKLGAILNNPQMMQQIMALAQTMGAGQPPKEEFPKVPKASDPSPAPPFPDIDSHMLQDLAGILRKSGMDQNQTALLHALSPYLSRNRINKLERAMHASKMAGAASIFLNSGGLQLLKGR